MILFDVILETTIDQREQFIALLTRTMDASQREPGCLIYRFTADLANAQRFYLVELWQDEAALAGHATGPAFKNFLAELPGCGRVVSSIARSGPLEPYVFKRPQ